MRKRGNVFWVIINVDKMKLGGFKIEYIIKYNIVKLLTIHVYCVLPVLTRESASVWMTSTKSASEESRRTSESVSSKAGPAGSSPYKKKNRTLNKFYVHELS